MRPYFFGGCGHKKWKPFPLFKSPAAGQCAALIIGWALFLYGLELFCQVRDNISFFWWQCCNDVIQRFVFIRSIFFKKLDRFRFQVLAQFKKHPHCRKAFPRFDILDVISAFFRAAEKDFVRSGPFPDEFL